MDINPLPVLEAGSQKSVSACQPSLPPKALGEDPFWAFLPVSAICPQSSALRGVSTSSHGLPFSASQISPHLSLIRTLAIEFRAP